MKTKYELCEKIVKSGNSKVFKNWNEFTGITEEEFLKGLKWLYGDDVLGEGISDKELGITKDGKLHKLKRKRCQDTGIIAFYDENNLLWSNGISISSVDKI